MLQRSEDSMKSNRKAPNRYEILVGDVVCWRGNQPQRILHMLAQRFPNAQLAIRWQAGKELLIAKGRN
ncbi:MAG: hypothetical protein HY597_05185 [Candidatus Omnitrophica bacterium]|nr:hypothetical protein [Candidatus Omnitrophota bacterium]